MKNVALLAVIAALLRPAAGLDGPAERTFPADAVKSILVRTEGGTISLNVYSDEEGSTGVATATTAPADGCAVSRELRDGALTLTARSSSASSPGAARPCAAGFAVLAPAGVPITARSDSGNAEFGAFSGRIDVRTGSGAIVLNGPSGPLILRTGSGNVTGTAGGQDVDVGTRSGSVDLRGLTGSVKARAGGGIVALAWADAPPVGDIDVRTDDGDFLAALPADTKLKFSLKSGSGKVRSEFVSDAAATLSLTFRSRSGYATLKKSARATAAKELSPDQIFDRGDLLRW